jgi:hypothetical protein
MVNATAPGTLSKEDIYGVGSLDTLGGFGTQSKTNPNDSTVTGEVPEGKSSILNLKGRKILNQPLIVWAGIIVILLILKFGVEGKASSKLKEISL